MSENTATETGPDSGKPDKSGSYIICDGAKCKCNQSVEQQQGDLEVLSQSTTYINDTDGAIKLVGSTMDLGIPFKVKASTFGTCKLQPTGTSYLPCIPAVVSWSDAYDSFTLDNMGKALTKDSTAQCAIGGKIEFATHGQEQEVTQADAEKSSNQPALTLGLTDAQLLELVSGEFKEEEDKAGASVKSITTGDGKDQYFFNKKEIPLKVAKFSKSNPSEKSKKGVNWAVFHKKSGEPISKYKEQGVYTDVGEEFSFPFNIIGDYIVEAYGSTKGPFYLKNKSSAAYKKIKLRDQTIDGLSVTVDGDSRKRVRPTEISTIKMKSLFSNDEMTGVIGGNSVGKLIWDVKATYGKKNIPVNFKENALDSTELFISPIKTRANVIVRATSTSGITKKLVYKVGGNYVTAIKANKKTVSVWEDGEKKDRHYVKLSVSEYIIEPALDAEKTAVKWTNFKPDAKPDKNHVIATGAETTRYFKTPGVLMYEAFMNSPEGGEKRTTKRIEGVLPKITKAYWADSKGNKISRSGFEHTVYLHIETVGLTGEKLKFNVWESDKYYSDFIKNAGTEIEIDSHEGVINQEFKLPATSWFEQEYYFTIEKLGFTLLGTKQDADSNNEFVMWKNHTSKKVDYLYVNDKKKITSLKIYETGNKLHTGIVKYGDTLTIKLTSRNHVDEELEFELWKDPKFDNFKGDGYSAENTDDDIKFSETIKIKVDSEGNGTTDFKIPSSWKDYQGKAKAQFFYLKNGDEEFPRANYTKVLNVKDESSIKNTSRIIALMIKVSNTLELDSLVENASAVILGSELTTEGNDDEKCPNCENDITLKNIEDIFGVLSTHKAFRQKIVDNLNKYIKQKKDEGKPLHLDTCLRKAHFFAQVGAETLGIHPDWMVETDVIKYREGNIVPALFGARATKLIASGNLATYCSERPQKKLLSYLYAKENGFGNGNGNEASEDGYTFRGRGLKQLTGRGNYKTAATYLKDTFPNEYIDVEADPDKVKEAKYAVLTAIAYWESKSVWQTADVIKVVTDSDVKKIRRKVNGATAGWKDVKKFLIKGLKVFKQAECTYGATKVEGENDFGLVQITKQGNPYIINSGNEDSYSYTKKDGTKSTKGKHGDDWILPAKAKAFSDAVYKLVEEYPVQKVHLGDCSAYNPAKNLGHSATGAHSSGNAFDCRFLKSDGSGSNSIYNLTDDEIALNGRFIEILKETGQFSSFYTEQGEIPGSVHSDGHHNHIHGN